MITSARTTLTLELDPAIRRGLLPGTSGNGATGWVDVRDIADVAVRVLFTPDLQGDTTGRSHVLTGTYPLSFPEVAAILTSELGHRVRYLHVPAPLMLAGLRAGDVPSWQARGLVHQFVDVVRRGADRGRVHSDDLERILGRAPRDITDFAAEHRDALRR